MTESQFEGFDSVAGTSTAADVEEESREDSQLVDAIGSMGQNLGLEMDSGDVEKLLDEHRDEITIEELQQLQEGQKRTLTKEMSSDEDEGRKIVSTADIKEICAKWNDIQNFVELYHPDKATSSRAVYMFNALLSATFVKFLNGGRSQLRLISSLQKGRNNL